MTHSCVQHDSCTCVTWEIFTSPCYTRNMATLQHTATWLIHIYNMTVLNVWHDFFICVPWVLWMCDMTHSYVQHDSLKCVTQRFHVWQMSLVNVWHENFSRVSTISFTQQIYSELASDRKFSCELTHENFCLQLCLCRAPVNIYVYVFIYCKYIYIYLHTYMCVCVYMYIYMYIQTYK